MDHIMAGIGKVSDFEKTPNFTEGCEGHYKLKLIMCKQDVGTKSRRPFFAAEFEVLESTNANRPIKTRVSVVEMLDNYKYKDSMLKRIANLLSALSGGEKITEDAGCKLYDLAVSPKNPFAGLSIYADVSTNQTRTGNKWTSVKFSPCAN